MSAENKIKVLLVKPMERPQVVEIEDEEERNFEDDTDCIKFY